ncbi:MAG: ABC transporter ATP-binding protein/permease [Oscillospiraceae bacterium]|jgi:ABC-type multidrug transport system fused ATPase/permease subunit|nr:ABC transporter ATP-binding protein/permease [Oscillospiraceae bacterium]
MKTFFALIRQNDIKYVRFFLFYLAAALAIALCTVFAARVTGSMGQAAQTAAQTAGETAVLVGLLLALAGFTGAKVVFSAAATLFSKRYIGKTEYKMRRRFAAYLAYISYRDFSQKNSGETLSLYTGDLPGAASFLTAFPFSQATQLTALAVSAVFLALIDPLLTLIYFVMFPPVIFIQALISKPLGARAMERSTRRAAFNAVVNDALQNPGAIVAYSLEGAMERRFQTAYDKYFEAGMGFARAMVRLAGSGVVLAFLPSLVMTLVAGARAASGAMTVADFIAFTTIADASGSWLVMLGQDLSTMRQGAAQGRRLLESTAEPHEPLDTAEPTPDAARATGETAALRFDGVTFGYTEEQPVLRGLSFTVPVGVRAAVVGPSGCGKSTVMKLLLGLYEPQGGAIRIGGSDLRDLGKKALRSQVSYVPQDCFLLPVSLRENIQGTWPHDPVKLEMVCRDAGIWDYIQSLPQGFDTVLGEAAQTLSGGQRQRIAMARAFYRDAPVILMDEATSALDPVTEQAVLDAFYRVTAGRTALVVAHRPAAVTACDLILVLDGGQVAETGTHEQLMARGGIYAALFKEGQHENVV